MTDQLSDSDALRVCNAMLAMAADMAADTKAGAIDSELTAIMLSSNCSAALVQRSISMFHKSFRFGDTPLTLLSVGIWCVGNIFSKTSTAVHKFWQDFQTRLGITTAPNASSNQA
jgi:hypothetical protein